MKISKILAGMSAAAIVASMAIMPAAAATTITIDNGTTDEWSNVFPKFTNAEGKEADDFVDGKTFTKDTELKMTVHFEWTEKGKTEGYCAIKPAFANGWKPIYEAADLAKSGVAVKSTLTEVKNDDGSTTWKDADGNVVTTAVQDDGFVQFFSTDVTEFTYTVSSDVVNTIINNANAENGFDGIVFQVGNNGLKVTSIDFSQDNVKLASVTQNETPADSTASGTESKKDEPKKDDKSSAAATSSTAAGTTSSKAAGTTSSKAATSTAATSSAAASDNTAATGATAGLALAGVALAGAAVVISKRK